MEAPAGCAGLLWLWRRTAPILGAVSRETQFGHLFILQRGIIQPATVPFLNIAAYFSAQFYADSFCFCLFGFKILYQTVTGLKKDLSGVQKV